MEEREFECVGDMPLLMSANDLDLQAEVKKWIGDHDIKGTAGDDRSPVWTWTSRLYRGSKGYLAIPSMCIMAAIRLGGSKMPLGKSNWSKPSQFGLGFADEFVDFFSDGKQVPLGPIDKLVDRDRDLSHTDFNHHAAEAEKVGVNLFRSPVRIMGKRHIRIRPKFANWSIKGIIRILDPMITDDILKTLFDKAGRYGGLGDWSPHAGKPGPHGTFTTTIRPVGGKKKSA